MVRRPPLLRLLPPQGPHLQSRHILNQEKAPCSPYVWLLKITPASLTLLAEEGVGVEAGFFSEEEAPKKLREFLPKSAQYKIKTAYQADFCNLNQIDGREATDAIQVALSRYFLGDNEEFNEALAPYKVSRPIDFEIITPAPRQRTIYFTLNPDKTLTFPTCPK